MAASRHCSYGSRSLQLCVGIKGSEASSAYNERTASGFGELQLAASAEDQDRAARSATKKELQKLAFVTEQEETKRAVS